MRQTRKHRKRSAAEAHSLPQAARAATEAPAPAAAGSTPTGRTIPMPDWKWKTFPVYFAFAIGGFVGMYTGVIAGAAESSTYFTFIAIFWAVLLGFGFSRFTTRWIVSRQWARRQARKRQK
jgi:hypothetical protein